MDKDFVIKCLTEFKSSGLDLEPRYVVWPNRSGAVFEERIVVRASGLEVPAKLIAKVTDDANKLGLTLKSVRGHATAVDLVFVQPVIEQNEGQTV